MGQDCSGSDGMSEGRVLALDVGRRRVGVALSDPQRIAVKPLCVIGYRGVSALLHRVRQLVRQHDVKVVVVGLPRRTDGKKGDMEAFVLRIVEALRKGLPCKVDTIEEFYTTKMAVELLGRSTEKGALDMKAAQIILVDYLKRMGTRKDHPATPEPH